MKLKMQRIKCLRCGHDWLPRQLEIRMCPKCKSPYFDVPKKVKEKR